jgi:hypothetical protein
MNREVLLRRALWLAALFNLAGAAMFAFPASIFGALGGLPPDVPVLYRAFVALFVLLFGGAYAWQAQHRPIIKPFVAFGAIGKTGAFLLMVALWLCGEAKVSGVILLGGDLGFAAFFAWCLAGL